MATLFTYLQNLTALANDEEGQGLAEYGLIIALVAVVAIAALTALGGGIVSSLGEITAAL